MGTLDAVMESIAKDRSKVVEYIANLTDDDLKMLIKEYQYLREKGLLPSKSNYQKLTAQLSKVFGMTFDLKLTESFLTPEIYKRFLNKP